MRIEVGLPDALWKRYVRAVGKGVVLRVVPVIFSIGVNEMQTVAHAVGDERVQDEVRPAPAESRSLSMARSAAGAAARLGSARLGSGRLRIASLIGAVSR